jgi:hypothetical protein
VNCIVAFSNSLPAFGTIDNPDVQQEKPMLLNIQTSPAFLEMLVKAII